MKFTVECVMSTREKVSVENIYELVNHWFSTNSMQQKIEPWTDAHWHSVIELLLGLSVSKEGHGNLHLWN